MDIVINTIVGIVGSTVGIIGIIVGVIGWKSLQTSLKLQNKATADNGSTIIQAQTITQGVGEDSVKLLAKAITKEQMCRLIVKLIPINTDNDECIAKKLMNNKLGADDFDMILNEVPSVYYGHTEPPKDAKDGSVWIDYAK